MFLQISFLCKISLLAWFFPGLALSLTPSEWRSQSIYQVMTDRFARTDGSTSASCNLGSYCGGTWKGLINKLDYIQNMGFTAVWVSPVVENVPNSTTDGSPYHGYWAQDIYQVNTNFGPAADLVSLSNSLHARGMYLMVDVAPNHMAYAGCAECVDYSVLKPFNQQSYYHSYCPIDYDNATSTLVCWAGDNVVALPDLRTENSDVRTMWQTWAKRLVSNYTIDGLRLDSAKSIEKDFFPGFVSAAGVYTIGEVLDGNPYTFCPYQSYLDGMLNYPAYYWITQAFKSTTGSISNLVNGINIMRATCGDTTLLGSFIENHDQVRFPSYTSDLSLTKNAIAFTMLSDGMPIIYQGQEQHFSGGSVPQNREALWTSGYSTSTDLYSFITKLNKVRNQAITQDTAYVTSEALPVYSDSSTIVMRKGTKGSPIISVFTNLGSSGSSSFILPAAKSSFTATQKLTEVISCNTYTTDSNGNLTISIKNGIPQIFYPTTQLSGSGLCNSSLNTSPSTTSTKATPSSTSSMSSSTTLSTSTKACVTPTAVAITFEDEVVTKQDQTLKLVGSVPQLGSWNTSKAITLSDDDSAQCDPYWFGTVSLTPGLVVEYKYIKVGSDNSVTWEADPNHTYTVPSGCQPTPATVSNTWQ